MAKNQAYLFAGQAAQFVGMGEQLYDAYQGVFDQANDCLLYTSPSPRDRTRSRMPSSA